VFCCATSLVGQRQEDKCSPSYGEAIANDRRDINTKLGIAPSAEVCRYSRWK
jgi:hypothetical protein